MLAWCKCFSRAQHGKVKGVLYLDEVLKVSWLAHCGACPLQPLIKQLNFGMGFYLFFYSFIFCTQRGLCFALLFLHLSCAHHGPVVTSFLIMSISYHIWAYTQMYKQISIILQHLVRPGLQIDTDCCRGNRGVLLTLGFPRAAGQWAYCLAVRCSKR